MTVTLTSFTKVDQEGSCAFFHVSSRINPIRLRGFGSLGCNSASASLMASNCALVDSLMSFWSVSDSSMSCLMRFISFSILSNRSEVSGIEVMRRNATKARMISRLTFIAVFDLSTLLSIATPSSVNAKGKYLKFCPRLLFKVPNWHLESSSIYVKIKIRLTKSSPKALARVDHSEPSPSFLWSAFIFLTNSEVLMSCIRVKANHFLPKSLIDAPI